MKYLGGRRVLDLIPATVVGFCPLRYRELLAVIFVCEGKKMTFSRLQ